MSDRGQDVNLPAVWTRDAPFHTPGVWHMQYRDTRRPRDPVLDAPSEPHPILNALMDRVMVRLEMLANGAVMPLTQRVKGGRDELDGPGRYNGSDVTRLARQYYKAPTHRLRLLVIKAAQDKVNAFQFSPGGAEHIRGTEAWKARIAADTRPYNTLTHVYGISKRDVTAYKKQYKAPAAGTNVAPSATVPYVQDAK